MLETESFGELLSLIFSGFAVGSVEVCEMVF